MAQVFAFLESETARIGAEAFMSGDQNPYLHVFRMAGLFAVGIGAFLVLRALYVPGDFGTFGHYRPAALEANRAVAAKLAGRASCETCHTEIVEARKDSKHGGVGCEACHGPLARHASGDDQAPKPVKPDAARLCLTCHRADASKPRTFKQIVPANHYPGEVCTSCHNAHKPQLS
ncbi:MAG: multiheme c-type cytochrome, partial [Acidobacteriota bacterium]